MRTFLCILWLSSCLMKLSSSSPAVDLNNEYDVSEDGERSVFRKDYTLDDEEQGWFKLHRVPEQWEKARERCELEGAELASPLDGPIHKAMVSKIEDLSGVFTGIHSIFSYGDYYSLKGVPLNDMPVNWSNSLTSDKHQRCIELLPDGTITNVKCGFMLPYICYKKNDDTPITQCGTIDTEYTLNHQLGTCYKLHTENKNWNDAFKTCSAEGGHLTVINSDVERAAVIQLFNNTVNGENIKYKVSIGISYREPGPWVTIHDEKLEKSGFSTWSCPNHNNFIGEMCGALRRSGLVPVECDVPSPFVCEKKPNSLVDYIDLRRLQNHESN